MTVKATRLRYISAKATVELTTAVSQLPFKVEIKGGPIYDGKRWFLFFVIPDEVQEFINVEL